MTPPEPNHRPGLPAAPPPMPPPTVATPVVLSPVAAAETVLPAGSRPRHWKGRLALALALAAASDVLSWLLVLAPPAQWAVDFGTALLLFAVLGWHWWLLPGLVMEAIPGVYVFPFWVLVVCAIAVTGSPRPEPTRPPGDSFRPEKP